MYNIFLSYIREEALVAGYIKYYLEERFQGQLKVFMSAECIAGGEDWFRTVTESLKSARVLLVLCSAFSVRRPWINFELGLAWDADKIIIPLCHRGFTPAQLPSPISNNQAFNLLLESDAERLVDHIAEQFSIAHSSGSSANFVRNLPGQNASAAESYIGGILSAPVTQNLTLALLYAYAQAERDRILTTAHLFLGLLSLPQGLLLQVICNNEDDVEHIEQLVKQSIEAGPIATDTQVTKTFREIVDSALEEARRSAVLLDQLHLLTSLFRYGRGLGRYLKQYGYNFNDWQSAIEQLKSSIRSTPYKNPK